MGIFLEDNGLYRYIDQALQNHGEATEITSRFHTVFLGSMLKNCSLHLVMTRRVKILSTYSDIEGSLSIG